MTYEVKTPLILESVTAARAAISGIQDGSMEPRFASVVLAGARVLQGAVREDIRARLADPRIRAQEAKLIEGERGQQIAGSAA
jgi:hypothetical protein